MRGSPQRWLVLWALALLFSNSVEASVVQGDQAWAQRAEAISDRFAESTRVETAIGHYRSALKKDGSGEPLWKLIRALHYLIEFTDAEELRKQAALDEALALARRATREEFASRAKMETRSRLYFWSAIAWGARASRVGLLTIVREGAASRIHELAERSASLDPGVDRGGPLRLLSRLHADLPRVPFISGWVDRSKALSYAERAVHLDGEHPGNRLVLALVLLEQVLERRKEAVTLLQSVAVGQPTPELLVEELTIREEARKRLAEIAGQPTDRKIGGAE